MRFFGKTFNVKGGNFAEHIFVKCSKKKKAFFDDENGIWQVLKTSILNTGHYSSVSKSNGLKVKKLGAQLLMKGRFWWLASVQWWSFGEITNSLDICALKVSANPNTRDWKQSCQSVQYLTKLFQCWKKLPLIKFRWHQAKTNNHV